MSGHSRWSQIKRKKGKADVQRGKLFSKILREITVAARNGGGDSKVNMRLKAAMESAKEANMPHENIKRAVLVDAGKIGEDDLMTRALEAGATDMRRVEKAFEITTTPAEIDAVRTA